MALRLILSNGTLIYRLILSNRAFSISRPNVPESIPHDIATESEGGGCSLSPALQTSFRAGYDIDRGGSVSVVGRL